MSTALTFPAYTQNGEKFPAREVGLVPSTYDAKPTHSDKFRGEKYDDALSITQCAARIRADIKEAVRTGALPTGTYSVTRSRGRAINVRISHIPFMIPNRQRVCFEVHHPNLHVNGGVIPLQSEVATAVLGKVNAIMSAYNRDNSDMQSDYFDVNFYKDTSFDWEWVKGQREAMEAQERERPSWEFEVDPKQYGNPLRSWRETRPAAGVKAGA